MMRCAPQFQRQHRLRRGLLVHRQPQQRNDADALRSRRWSSEAGCRPAPAPASARRSPRTAAANRGSRCGARRCWTDSPRNIAIMAIAAIPIGRLTQNTSCQLTCSTRKAPSDGPSTAAKPNTLDTRPCTCARSVGRIDVAENGGGDRLNAAGAEALQRAEQDQRGHVAGEAAQSGTDQEQTGSDKEHLLAAIDVGESRP